MADDKRDNLTERLVEDGSDAALAAPGERSFRARVEKFALPGVMALAVAAGLIFGGVAPDGAGSQTLTAAPAGVTSDINRAADGTSRDRDRAAAADSADPAPETQTPDLSSEATGEDAAPPEAAPGEPAGQSPVTTQSKALSAISTSAPSATAPGASGSKMYATETVNVRAQSSASSDRIGSVDKGQAVDTTGQTGNGFTEVSVGGRNGWITSEFLSKTAPTTSGSSSTASNAEPSVRTNANCPVAVGVTPRAVTLNHAICDRFPSVRSYGGYRAGDSGAHGQGRALDVMISGATGTDIANWARANAGTYGITEVIWQQRIWTTQRSGEGWRGMSDRGSATANHFDHVHITLA